MGTSPESGNWKTNCILEHLVEGHNDERERERKRGELGEIFQAPAEEVVKKKIKAGH